MAQRIGRLAWLSAGRTRWFLSFALLLNSKKHQTVPARSSGGSGHGTEGAIPLPLILESARQHFYYYCPAAIFPSDLDAFFQSATFHSSPARYAGWASLALNRHQYRR